MIDQNNACITDVHRIGLFYHMPFLSEYNNVCENQVPFKLRGLTTQTRFLQGEENPLTTTRHIVNDINVPRMSIWHLCTTSSSTLTTHRRFMQCAQQILRTRLTSPGRKNHIWDSKNHYVTQQVDFNLWLSTWTVHSSVSPNGSQVFLMDLFEGLPFSLHQAVWFQQDGAVANNSIKHSVKGG